MMKATYHKKAKTSIIILLLLIILCSFRFFNYYLLSNNMQKLPGMLVMPVLFLASFNQIFKKDKDVFYKLMKCLVLSWLLSFFMAFIFWDQSLSLTYRASVQSLFFVIFFIFNKIKIDRITLEKLIIIMGWGYIALWIYAMLRSPEITFGFIDDDSGLNDQRGIFRINFIGWTCLPFTFFYYFNKCFISKSPKYKIFAIIFFIFIVLQVTRQLILCTAIISIIYIFFKSKKISALCAIIFFSLYIGSAKIEFSDNSVMGSLINLTNSQMKGELYSTDEDIRVLEYKYFLTKWPKNPLTTLFGDGYPHFDSKYGTFYTTLNTTDKIYLSDVGYPSMYVILGIFGLGIYLLLFIKGSLQKLPSELNYARMFMGFLLISNFISAWYLGADSELTMCIAVYLIYLYRKGSPLLELKKD